MLKIVPGVFAHARASIYQYLIVENQRSTLIDAGLPLFSASLVRKVSQLTEKAPLELILITHADGDHYGSVNQLKRLHHCQVAASLPEARAMSAGSMSRSLKPRNAVDRALFSLGLPFFSAPPSTAEIILHPGDELPILGGLQVLDSSGHTPGHLSFYQPDQRLLFAGDSIIQRSGIPSPAFGPNCWDEQLAQDAFERQMDLKPLHICGGHSTFKLTH